MHPVWQTPVKFACFFRSNAGHKLQQRILVLHSPAKNEAASPENTRETAKKMLFVDVYTGDWIPSWHAIYMSQGMMEGPCIFMVFKAARNEYVIVNRNWLGINKAKVLVLVEKKLRFQQCISLRQAVNLCHHRVMLNWIVANLWLWAPDQPGGCQDNQEVHNVESTDLFKLQRSCLKCRTLNLICLMNKKDSSTIWEDADIVYSIQYTVYSIHAQRTTKSDPCSKLNMNIGSFPFISCTVKATLSSASSTSRVVVTTAKRGWALKEVKKRTMQSRQYLGLVLKQVRRQELCQYCNCNTNSNPCSHHLSFPQTGDNSEIGHVIIHIVCLAMTFFGFNVMTAAHATKSKKISMKQKQRASSIKVMPSLLVSAGTSFQCNCEPE